MFLLQQRSGETVKVHQLDVAIPLQLKSQLKKGGSREPCIGEDEADASDTMQFVMLTRKGNKQQVYKRSLLLSHNPTEPRNNIDCAVCVCVFSGAVECVV